MRWALPPGDLQHSRYSTATFPKLSVQPGALSTKVIWSQLSLEHLKMYEIQHSLGSRTQPILVSTQMRPGLIPFSPPRDTFAYNGLSSLNTRCSEPFIYSSIHQSRLRLRWSATVNNTQLERAEIVGQMIINRSEVLIHWGATSRLALSSTRFNLRLMSRLMTACFT